MDRFLFAFRFTSENDKPRAVTVNRLDFAISDRGWRCAPWNPALRPARGALTKDKLADINVGILLDGCWVEMQHVVMVRSKKGAGRDNSCFRFSHNVTKQPVTSGRALGDRIALWARSSRICR
jgi:hypothetical protein